MTQLGEVLLDPPAGGEDSELPAGTPPSIPAAGGSQAATSYPEPVAAP